LEREARGSCAQLVRDCSPFVVRALARIAFAGGWRAARAYQITALDAEAVHFFATHLDG
jgi:hypothetical protein